MAEIPQEARIFKGPTRERARVALVTVIEEAMRADKKVIGVTKLRAAGSKDQNCTTTMLRLWRGGLSMADSWDDPPAPVAAPKAERPESESELTALVRAAQSHDDLLAAGKQLAVDLAEGRVDPDVAARLTNLLTEMRQSVKGRALEPKEDVESVLPVTEEAAPLVEAFEAITDDDERVRVLEMVQAAAEADRAKRPSLDTGGAQGEVTA